MSETLIKLTKKDFDTLKKDDVLLVKDRIRNKKLVNGLNKLPCPQLTYINDKCLLVIKLTIQQ